MCIFGCVCLDRNFSANVSYLISVATHSDVLDSVGIGMHSLRVQCHHGVYV